MASLQINDTLAQLRPADVLDDGITNEEGGDHVPEPDSKPDASDKVADKPKEATAMVPYYKLFRYDRQLAFYCLAG